MWHFYATLNKTLFITGLALSSVFFCPTLHGMGNKIAPEVPAVKKISRGNKKLLSDAIMFALNEEVEIPDGGISTPAQLIAKRLVSTAMFAEANKDATSAAKLLLEYSIGKPAVVQNDKKEDITKVAFVFEDADLDKIAKVAAKDAGPDDGDDDEVSGVAVRMEDGSEMVL